MRKLILLLAMPALISAAPPPEPSPGEGVLCLMVFVDAAAETGRRCFPGQNPAYQARLESVEKRFDVYVLKNEPATPEQLATFKRKQAGIGRPTFDCKEGGDMVLNYKHFLNGDPKWLTTDIDKLLARPGKPSFGDCV